jgi:WhiB family redox-sensing transcriptional regulator
MTTALRQEVPITAERPTSGPVRRASTRRTDTRPRICGEPGCDTRLSAYNKTAFCSLHSQAHQPQRRSQQLRAATPPYWPGRACDGQDLNLFFAPDEVRQARQTSFRYTKARKLCQACPFQDPCGEWAIETEQEHGMWCGKTPEELRAERHRRHEADARTRGAA